MSLASGLIAVILLFYVVYLALSSLLLSRRRARCARQLGCQLPPIIPCADPFGIETLRQIAKADEEKRLPDWMLEQFEKTQAECGFPPGTCRVLSPPGKWQFFTTEPKNIQTVLASQFQDFEMSKERIGNVGRLLGKGIFTTNGKEWSHSRNLLRPQFSREQVSDLSIVEAHVQTLIQVIEAKNSGASDWMGKIDLSPLFFNLTLDSATEFLFGESAESQLAMLPGVHGRSRHPEGTNFGVVFDRAQMIVAEAARMGDLWWLSRSSELKKLTKLVNQYVDYYVRIALELPVGQEKQDKPGRYIFLHALAQHTRDPVELRAQLLNILLAGRDTTASLLGWLFLLLGDPKHAEILKRLRQTVVTEFGTFDHPKNITFASLKSCQYLQWCLNETLRLYPIVPVNDRVAAVDTTLPTGGGPDGQSPIFIAKGNMIHYSVYVMQRRRDLWGEDAEVFRPERWNKRRPGWEYLPFNGGPRICIGQQLALTEAGYVTVRLLQRYDAIEGVLFTDKPLHKLALTTSPADGVNVKLRMAKS